MTLGGAPIAVFDSGMGGLTVLDRLQKKFPQESFVYLGDTARLPYGTKSADTVRQYAVQMADCLMGFRPKAMVIACNTASAVGLDAVRDHVGPIPVIGMIEPAARAAVQATRSGRIAVLGTHGTVRSGAYRSAIAAMDPGIEVQALACPLLVPLAEEGWVDHPAARDILETYLAPLLADRARADTVILGCTHFPVFMPLLEHLLPGVTFIHCGETAALALAQSTMVPAVKEPLKRGQIDVYLTDLVPQFDRYLETFLGTAGVGLSARLMDVCGRDHGHDRGDVRSVAA